jgi:hypothetical protein
MPRSASASRVRLHGDFFYGSTCEAESVRRVFTSTPRSAFATRVSRAISASISANIFGKSMRSSRREV